jgi:hypothetical protein
LVNSPAASARAFTSSRARPIPYNKAPYRQRNLIERMFARLKDFRRIATRYDKLARNFLAGAMIVATVVWWLNRGMQAARGKLIARLNTDLLLDVNLIARFRETMELHSDVGVLGAKHICPQTGTIQHLGIFGWRSLLKFESPIRVTLTT